LNKEYRAAAQITDFDADSGIGTVRALIVQKMKRELSIDIYEHDKAYIFADEGAAVARLNSVVMNDETKISRIPEYVKAVRCAEFLPVNRVGDAIIRYHLSLIPEGLFRRSFTKIGSCYMHVTAYGIQVEGCSGYLADLTRKGHIILVKADKAEEGTDS